MKWLDRVRQKNPRPTPPALTKLTEGGSVSATQTCVSFVSAPPGGDEGFGRSRAVSSAGVVPLRHEVIRVAYQVIWYDYDVRDGVYTPEQLQRARKVVKRGPVRHYLLRWPGGQPAPAGGRYAMRA